VVPERTAHLLAKGVYRGSERTVEAILHLPLAPYGLAAAGPIEARGGVTVSAVNPATGQADLPADILTNATDSRAVNLGAATLVKGNITSAGGILLAPGATVEGERLEFASPGSILQMQASTYDPAANGQAYLPLQPVYLEEATWNGTLRAEGPVLVRGGVVMDGALVYIDGDLTVRGPLRGRGVIVVTGDILVEDMVALETENEVAFLCKGRFEIRGRGPASSNLRGIVYCEGGFFANKVTLRGTLVANGPEGAPRPEGVELDEVVLIQDSEASPISVEVNDEGAGGQVGGGQSESDDYGNAMFDLMQSPDGGGAFLWDSTGEAPGASVAQVRFEPLPDGRVRFTLTSALGHAAAPQEMTLMEALIQIRTYVLNIPIWDIREPGMGRLIPPLTSEQVRAAMRASVSQDGDGGSGGEGGTGGGVTGTAALVTISPSDFFPTEERARLLFSREF
jgi:cytoskeletal protein CcmA (bactofilin family)